ncbi:hypothetical protein JYG30_11930 [Fibrella sp. USSR17]
MVIKFKKLNLKTVIKLSAIDAWLFIYLLIAFLFFIYIAKDDIDNATLAVSSTKTLGIYADHPTYVNFFKELGDSRWLFLIVKPNYAGPFIMMAIIGDKLLHIFLFNTFIFLLTVKLSLKNIPLNRSYYLLLLLLNPITFISLFSINKEIFTFCSVTLYCIFLLKNSKLFFIMSLIISILARKELTILFIFYHIFSLSFSNHYKYPIRYSVIILIITTIGGFAIDKVFSSIDDYAIEVELTVESSGSGGTILLLNKIQKSYGYIWSFLPKTFLNLFGSVFSRTQNLFNFQHVYNDVVVWGQSLLFIYLIPITLKKYYNINTAYPKKLMSLFAISCILFSYIPVIQNRYFYTGYIILLILVSFRELGNITRSIPTTNQSDNVHSN